MSNLQVLDLAMFGEHVGVQLFHGLFDIASFEVEIFDGIEEFVEFCLTGRCAFAKWHSA